MNPSYFILFTIFPFVIHSTFKNSLSETKCIGNNSFINENGKCECKKNFPFGNPDSIEGCFKCEPACGQNSICYMPNKCKCLPGFYQFGNNSETCKSSIPELLSAYPISGPVSGGTKVSLGIKSQPNFSIQKAFCRFGPISVPATFSNGTLIICISPHNRRGKVPLGISMDSTRWSKQEFSFIYYREGYNVYNCILLCILVTIISLILIIIFWFLKSKKELLALSEEMLPLNQWHMNQEFGTLTEEKGFLDFVKNVVIY